MDKKLLHDALSVTLKQYGIDDLGLELLLVAAVEELEGKDTPQRTPEDIRKGVAEALRKSGAEADIRQLIHSTIASDLHLNPSSKDGQDFIEFAYLGAKHGEEVSTFIHWWLVTFPDPKYWSFRRMREMWPQAFVKKIGGYVTPKTDKWEQEGLSHIPEKRSQNEQTN